jgi:uncharacterized protein (TIGR02118 family)
MIVRLGMAPRIDGLTCEEFQAHWRTSHADVVSFLPGLRRYQQFHAVLEGGAPLLDHPGFDACSALRFDSLEDMDAAFAAPQVLEAVRADEAAFVDKTRFRGVVGSWRPDRDADLGEGGEIQVLTLLRAEPGTAPTELASRLADAEEGTAGGAIVADRDAHEGRFPVTADVVRVTGHQDVGSALAAAARARAAAGAATVLGQHVARIVDVPPRAVDPRLEGTGA